MSRIGKKPIEIPAGVDVQIDGTLITVYYQRYENDTYCSLLYTKWKLSEIE